MHELQALQKLDLRCNAIGSLRELAVLAGLPNLRDLQLEGGQPGNSVCSVPGYRYRSFCRMLISTRDVQAVMQPRVYTA